MTKTNVQFGCGHVNRINLQGPHRDRERFEQYAATRDCYKCEEKSLQLPPLEGSEEHLEWAMTIRFRAWRDLEKSYSFVFESIEEFRIYRDQFFKAHLQVSFWIDHNYSNYELFFLPWYLERINKLLEVSEGWLVGSLPAVSTIQERFSILQNQFINAFPSKAKCTPPEMLVFLERKKFGEDFLELFKRYGRVLYEQKML